MIAGSQRHSSKVAPPSPATLSPRLGPIPAPVRRSIATFDPRCPQPASISFISLRLRTLDLSCTFFPRLDPLFSIACALFDQNTRGGIPHSDFHQSQAPLHPRPPLPPSSVTTFRINTCKSVSKQKTLTSFRMNTYEKRGGGGHPWSAAAFWCKMPGTSWTLGKSHLALRRSSSL